MKALKLFLLFALAVILYSCAQDDFEAYTTDGDKIALYKAKAKEFAEKYHVQMSLEDSQIKELIKKKSIDDMEKDFMFVSNLLVQADVPAPNNIAAHKLRIKKKMALNEGGNVITGGDIMGEFDFHTVYTENLITGRIVWTYNRKHNSYVQIYIRGPYSFISEGIATCITYKDGFVKFDVEGDYDFHGSGYKLTLHCSVTYDQELQSKTISISPLSKVIHPTPDNDF